MNAVPLLGTAALVYNDRSQLTSNTDSNGNAVIYEYDTVGRVSKVTPPQGANYRTQYTYNKNGNPAWLDCTGKQACSLRGQAVWVQDMGNTLGSGHR